MNYVNFLPVRGLSACGSRLLTGSSGGERARSDGGAFVVDFIKGGGTFLVSDFQVAWRRNEMKRNEMKEKHGRVRPTFRSCWR